MKGYPIFRHRGEKNEQHPTMWATHMSTVGWGVIGRAYTAMIFSYPLGQPWLDTLVLESFAINGKMY